jgi:hypothetical protein
MLVVSSASALLQAAALSDCCPILEPPRRAGAPTVRSLLGALRP